MIFILANWKWLVGAVASAGLLVALLIARTDANHWHKVADQRAATIAQFSLAQKAATDAAIKAKADQEATYKGKADVADTNNADAAAAAHDAVAEYVRTHRVPACSAGGSTGISVAAASGSNPQSAVGPDPASVVVAEADVTVCTANTLRLEAAHDWAAGLAKP